MGNVRHAILHEQLWVQKPMLLSLSIFIHIKFGVSFSERRREKDVFQRKEDIS